MELNEKIQRNEFLKQLGFGGAALFALYTLDSCEQSSIDAAGVTFDLNDAANANLKKDGGYVIKSQVVLANNKGTYIAASLNCTHENLKEMTFRNGEWFCTEHDARFDLNGKGLNKNGSKGLTLFNVSVAGNIVTVTNK